MRTAADWLEAQIAGGRLATLDFSVCYKMVYAFALAGKVSIANECLDHCVRIANTEPGVFTPPPDMAKLDFDAVMRWYFHSVLLMGASQLGRWDVASPAALDALASQITDIGGNCGGIGVGSFL